MLASHHDTVLRESHDKVHMSNMYPTEDEIIYNYQNNNHNLFRLMEHQPLTLYSIKHQILTKTSWLKSAGVVSRKNLLVWNPHARIQKTLSLLDTGKKSLDTKLTLTLYEHLILAVSGFKSSSALGPGPGL